jgi:Ser/Thr protein kinase RdoA (MazF antagonist)
VRWLVACCEPPAGPAVCLHGDLHPKNGIVTQDGVALIDLDQSAAGPAAADVGSLLAGLRYGRRIGLLSGSAERRLSAAFLAGYASTRPLPPMASLRWSMAAALLAERALRAVNRVRPEGLVHLDGLLADAHKALTTPANWSYV